MHKPVLVQSDWVRGDAPGVGCPRGSSGTQGTAVGQEKGADGARVDGEGVHGEEWGGKKSKKG